MTKLSDIKDIRMKMWMRSIRQPQTEDFSNYFRIYKKPDEELEGNFFCSPFYLGGKIVALTNNYRDRLDASSHIQNCLKNMDCLSAYLVYDFCFASVAERYTTNGEFEAIKKMLEQTLQGTDLYVAFMVSHYNQIARHTPMPLLKKEHYHLLFGKTNQKKWLDNDINISIYTQNLINYGTISVERDINK